MAGRLNFTLEQSQQFDLASIPEATADELEAEELSDTEAVEQLTETAAKEP